MLQRVSSLRQKQAEVVLQKLDLLAEPEPEPQPEPEPEAALSASSADVKQPRKRRLPLSEMTASQCPGRDDLLTPWEGESGTRRQNNCAELRGIAQKCAELRRIARYLPFTW